VAAARGTAAAVRGTAAAVRGAARGAVREAARETAVASAMAEAPLEPLEAKVVIMVAEAGRGWANRETRTAVAAVGRVAEALHTGRKRRGTGHSRQ